MTEKKKVDLIELVDIKGNLLTGQVNHGRKMAGVLVGTTPENYVFISQMFMLGLQFTDAGDNMIDGFLDEDDILTKCVYTRGNTDKFANKEKVGGKSIAIKVHVRGEGVVISSFATGRAIYYTWNRLVEMARAVGIDESLED